LINWTVFDVNPSNYTILFDDVEVTTLNWTTGQLLISYDIPTLTAGVYNYTIVARDLFGNTAADTIQVSVIHDITSPSIVGPDDIQFSLGASGMSILWNATDDYPGTYSILVEGVQDVLGSWENSVPIEYSLDELAAGSYNITIAVYDLSGNMISDTVIVTVQSGLLIPELMMLLGVSGVIGIVAVIVVLKVKGR
jgi:hypothetical protein